MKPDSTVLGATDRICDAATIFLAGWTLLAHLVVFCTGNLFHLLALAGAAGVSAATFWGWRRRSRTAVSAASSCDTPEASEPQRAPLLVVRSCVLAAALAGVVGYLATGRLLVFWLVALGTALLAVALEARVRPRWPEPTGRRTHEVILVALTLLCAVFTLAANRPDADDPFYLSLAVNAVDHPEAKLIAYDSMHGIPELPLSLPIYKVHSIELLEAAVAYLTGRPVLDIAHLALPLLASLLLPLASARLLRLLVPRRWLWSLVALLAFLVCVGAPHQGYGNFAFVRLHQGKAILLSVFIPLIIAYAIEFALSPSPGRWLRLAAAQIAAVGLSATALWCAPIVAGMALVSATAWSTRGLLRLALGLCASSYLLCLGLALRVRTETLFAVAGTDWGELGTSPSALSSVLGDGAVSAVCLLVLAGGWSLASGSLLRRATCVFALFFLLLFWNPFAAAWVAVHLTGEPTYWRIFWLVPVPLFVAVALTAPLEWGGRSGVSVLAVGLCGLLLFAWAPAAPSWSSANRVELGWPGWRVPALALRANAEIMKHAAAGERVLAAPVIATWLPTLHRHPDPLVVRHLYLRHLRPRLGDEEVERREQLAYLVAGRRRPPDAEDLLASAIADYDLAVVCLSGQATRWPELKRALSRSPLVQVGGEAEYEVWARR